MTHRTGRMSFALAVGLLVVLFAYRWITDPEPRAARAKEEQVVLASRQVLRLKLEAGILEIVDPLAPQPKVGKVYVYPEDGGWSVSGYYRRDENDSWHSYLMSLDDELGLLTLKLSDKSLLHRAIDDTSLDVVQ